MYGLVVVVLSMDWESNWVFDVVPSTHLVAYYIVRSTFSAILVIAPIIAQYCKCISTFKNAFANTCVSCRFIRRMHWADNLAAIDSAIRACMRLCFVWRELRRRGKLTISVAMWIIEIDCYAFYIGHRKDFAAIRVCSFDVTIVCQLFVARGIFDNIFGLSICIRNYYLSRARMLCVLCVCGLSLFVSGHIHSIHMNMCACERKRAIRCVRVCVSRGG